MGNGSLLELSSISMAKQILLLLETSDHTNHKHISRVLNKSRGSYIQMRWHLKAVDTEILNSSTKMAMKLKDIRMKKVKNGHPNWESNLTFLVKIFRKRSWNPRRSPNCRICSQNRFQRQHYLAWLQDLETTQT